MGLSTAVSLPPAWDWGGAAALCSPSPQDSCKVFCIFVFIDKYSLEEENCTEGTEDSKQGKALHFTLGAESASLGLIQGVFQQQYYPRSLLTPQNRATNGASRFSFESDPADIPVVYFKLSRRGVVSFQ